MIGNERELRTEFARIALMHDGTKQGSAMHKNIIDTFNSHAHCTWHVMTYDDPYCIAAASTFAIWAGIGDVFPLECNCAEAIKKAKSMGCWVEDEKKFTADVGDCILFDWQSTDEPDNKGTPDHIEIVVAVSKDRKAYLTVNPNDSSHGISLAEIPFGYKYIRGFIAPNYTKSKCYVKNGVIKNKKLSPHLVNGSLTWTVWE